MRVPSSSPSYTLTLHSSYCHFTHCESVVKSTIVCVHKHSTIHRVKLFLARIHTHTHSHITHRLFRVSSVLYSVKPAGNFSFYTSLIICVYKYEYILTHIYMCPSIYVYFCLFFIMLLSPLAASNFPRPSLILPISLSPSLSHILLLAFAHLKNVKFWSFPYKMAANKLNVLRVRALKR